MQRGVIHKAIILQFQDTICKRYRLSGAWSLCCTFARCFCKPCEERNIANLFNIGLSTAASSRIVEERFICLLQSCRTSLQLHQIQSQIITNGLQDNEYVAPKFVTACAEFKSMGYARKVFDGITERNTALWNAMYRGYLRNQSYREVVLLFSLMNRIGDAIPNCFTFPMILRSCSKEKAKWVGEEVHCSVIKGGFRSNSFVGTSLIEMYSSLGLIRDAYKVFGEMLKRNVVVWTSMINGYISCGDMTSAKRLFQLAPERDVILWNTLISGYIESGDIVAAREFFNKMPDRDVMSWNTMLNGYANNLDVEACEKLFQEMPQKNIFSWNGLIGAYARKGHYSKVLETFNQMLTEGDVIPNDATIVIVLSACARLGALDLGKWLHVYSENKGYRDNLFVRNALIDMYAKCGSVENAIILFNDTHKKDLITWNTVINGLALHGFAFDVLTLFKEMESAGERPDGITFIGVLCACTHMGLVEDGISYFYSMIDFYSIVPQIEHYGCMVDLLGRAGLVDQALNFVKKMPIEADAVIWAALLGSCRTHKNIEIAEIALERLLELEPNNPANLVMLSNIYKDLGRWKDVAKLKVAARDTGLKKLPGCSLIEVDDGVVEFYSLDERHPEKNSIYETLRGLTKLLRIHGYVPDLKEAWRGT